MPGFCWIRLEVTLHIESYHCKAVTVSFYSHSLPTVCNIVITHLLINNQFELDWFLINKYFTAPK